MGILLWIVFGAIVGWVASMIMGSNSGQGLIVDIIVGIVGAVLGGFLMQLLGQEGITGFNIYSMLVALLGACLALFIFSRFRRG